VTEWLTCSALVLKVLGWLHVFKTCLYLPGSKRVLTLVRVGEAEGDEEKK